MIRAVAVAAVAFAFFPFVAQASTQPAPARYLVCEIDRDDNITIRSAENVMLSEVRSDEPRGAGRDRIDVELFDRGRSVFRTAVDVDRYVRAEFHGPDGRIEGRWIEKERAAFVVRIPRTGDAIELARRGGGRTTRIAMDDLPGTSSTPGFIMGAESANSTNRLDILVMGDGYTSAQSSQFAADVANVMNDFFSIPPYSTYENYVNVTSFFVASPQSGADHPHCADGGPDPLEGTFVNTAFDATYCSFGIQRLLTVDDSKVYSSAASVPDWDKIIVIVNDPMYGGAGGGVSVVSTNEYAVAVAQHEFGHSFTGLADEYETAYPGFPACSDISGPSPCEANVTNVTTRPSIKWNPWIHPTTPVPTTPQTSYTTVPGLFEGARYQTSGYYRPKYTCLMNVLGVPFCEICAQSYILRLYNGWGGVPSAGIDPIEPGSASPSSPTVSGTVGVMQTFSATILEPAGGPSAQKQWFVDGVQQPSTTNTLNWTPGSSGAHTVELRVKDLTPLVHAMMAGTSLNSTHTWTVNVAAAGPTGFAAQGNAASVSLSWNAVAGASSYEVARSTGGAFSTIATVATNAYTDTAVSTNTAYVYKVRAAGGSYSLPDLAAVFTATDDPLAVGTTVQAVHLTQLRTAINAARTAVGLGAAPYTNTVVAGGIIRAIDVLEMRTAINDARTALGIATVGFNDSSLAGIPIRSVHVTELRNAVR